MYLSHFFGHTGKRYFISVRQQHSISGAWTRSKCLSDVFPRALKLPVTFSPIYHLKKPVSRQFLVPAEWCTIQALCFIVLPMQISEDTRTFWSNTHQCRPLRRWDSSPLKHNWIISRCPNQRSFQQQHYNFFSMDFHPGMLLPVTAIKFHEDLIKKSNLVLFRQSRKKSIFTIPIDENTAVLIRKIRVSILTITLRTITSA